ncbi:MAG: AraC family transcriptional regulator [Sphingobacteriales bacterium]|nr:MAG: AraC family transcriptional regulator [Sphingobacteriales bacterium]
MNGVEFQSIKPGKELSDVVESFWMLRNRDTADRQVIVLPDGRIDLIFSHSPTQPFHATLLGIGTHPDKAILEHGVVMCAVSFRLPAAEYVLHRSISALLNDAERLPPGFWNFDAADLHDFGHFCAKASHSILSAMQAEIDNRKRALFELVYASNGALTVQELSGKVYWSSRQINRYFNNAFGLSLKAYCNILRFRASFEHIHAGRLFPEEAFADQSHFIREVKRLSGVLPKELSRNQNDRFIQFSTLRKK